MTSKRTTARIWLSGTVLAAAVGSGVVFSPPATAAADPVRLASSSDAGVKGNNHSTVEDLGVAPSGDISADGTVVAFTSIATNLDPGDTDAKRDVYVKNLTTGELVLASTSDTGVKGNQPSYLDAISADGSMVAFSSTASNLDPYDTDVGVVDVYVKDLTTGDLRLISTSDADVKGNGSSSEATLSADGRRVAFSSQATNLDPADSGASTDVYVKDLTTGDIGLASTSDAGIKGNAGSLEPWFDGRVRLVRDQP